MRQKTGVTKRLSAVTCLAELRVKVNHIRGMDSAIRTLGLSNRLMARAMGEYRDGRDFYAASTVARWRHPRRKSALPMLPANLDHVARVIDDWLKCEAGRDDVRFTMTVNSPWRGVLEIRRACGHWERFDLRRAEARECIACRTEQ